MSDQIEKMRQIVKAKKQQAAAQNPKLRPEKNIGDPKRKVTKQHKKNGLFDGK